VRQTIALLLLDDAEGISATYERCMKAQALGSWNVS
jgi:hypothetical protein